MVSVRDAQNVVFDTALQVAEAGIECLAEPWA
jgi:hypothetical protein